MLLYWPTSDRVLFQIRELDSSPDNSPNVEFSGHLNSPVCHYSASQSLSLHLWDRKSQSLSSAQYFGPHTTAVLFVSSSPILMIRKVPPLCCLFACPIQALLLVLPSEREKAILPAIKTHDHNFLTSLYPPTLSLTHMSACSQPSCLCLLPRQMAQKAPPVSFQTHPPHYYSSASLLSPLS